MRYLPYILKHLRKNWIRTTSTILGIAVCIYLICVLKTLLAGIDYALEAASANRLVVRHAVSMASNLPLAYESRIAAVPGVKRVAISTWFGGVRGNAAEGGQAFKDFFNNMAVEAEPFLAMYPEFSIPPDQMRAFLEDPRGCVIGRGLVTRFGWKIGDTIQLESFIPPYRKGSPFEFVIRAIYDVNQNAHPGSDLQTMLFHFKYLYEGVGRRNLGVGTYMIELEHPDQVGSVSKAVDALFENSDVQTKTETEAAFAAGFVSMAGNLGLLINSIALAVTFTILLVTANTMGMAVRERRTEIAVLKTLGFPSRLVMSLVLGEAVAIGVLGGTLGLALAWVTARGLKYIPGLGAIFIGLPDVGLVPSVATGAFVLALVLGAAAGLTPALSAYRARITDMLRQV
ncbi:MAG: FtsX-like permease family protein [Vicinamibacterales bacterium]